MGIDIEGHAILFEDVKRKGSTQQIPFTGVLFVILGMKGLDCTHGVDRCTSTKKKRLEKKIKQVWSQSCKTSSTINDFLVRKTDVLCSDS